MQFTKRQTAAILYALRRLQDETESADDDFTYGVHADGKRLTMVELNKLCELINTPAPKRRLTPWTDLQARINDYTSAAIAESWKGGGDPQDVEILELRLKLTAMELTAYINKLASGSSR